MIEPVAGLTTSNVWPSAASTVSPPMTIWAAVGAGALEGWLVCDWVVIEVTSGHAVAVGKVAR